MQNSPVIIELTDIIINSADIMISLKINCPLIKCLVITLIWITHSHAVVTNIFATKFYKAIIGK